MNMEKILEIGAKLFTQKVGSSGSGLDLGMVVKALSGLLANSKGSIDLSSIVGNLDAGGLMSIASSWLGDGDNASISENQIEGLFETGKISGFARQLGLDKPTALKGLTAALPGIMDQSSKGGNIMDSLGGISDALGGLKGLFG